MTLRATLETPRALLSNLQPVGHKPNAALASAHGWPRVSVCRNVQ